MAELRSGGAPRYDRVRFVLGDGAAANATDIIASLYDRGLRRARACGSADQLLDALDGELVDVVMCDYDMMGDDFVEVMQSIRRKARGVNPFAIIVATVRDSAFDTVRRLIGAGVDDLIRKPISVERVFGSLNAFAAKRKPFTVSYNYVGPTRRLVDRPEDQAAERLVRVPNTLRSRAVEGVSDAELEHIVASAAAALEDRRTESYGYEIVAICRRAAEAYAEAADSHEAQLDFRTSLRQVELVADDLRSHCKNRPFARVGDLATMLIAVIDRAMRKPMGHADVEVQLIEKLAQAIHRALSSERASVDLMQEIATTIARYTSIH